MTDSPFRPVVRTQSELEQLWRTLMTPLGFERHTIWMVLIQDDRPIPQVMEIVETPDAPEPDDVVAFAGVEDFLDTPVKRFSSGMYVRLAFAVAAHLDDIAAVEDLAVAENVAGRAHHDGAVLRQRRAMA